MAKVINEQMQAVEAERAVQKSKRKEYSDAAVIRFVVFNDPSNKFLLFLSSGYNFVPKKKRK